MMGKYLLRVNKIGIASFDDYKDAQRSAHAVYVALLGSNELKHVDLYYYDKGVVITELFTATLSMIYKGDVNYESK